MANPALVGAGIGAAFAVPALALFSDVAFSFYRGQAEHLSLLTPEHLLTVALPVACLLAGYVFVDRVLLSPYRNLIKDIKIIALGSVETGQFSSMPELQAISQMMTAQKNEAHQLQNALSYSQAELQKARQDAQAAEKASRDAKAAQDHMIETVGVALKALRDGDMTFRLEEAFPLQYERLRHDFNDAAKDLQEVLSGLSASVATISSGSTEIASAADDLAMRTEQQVIRLEETTASVENVTATVQKTATATAHASEVAVQTRERAEKSGAVVIAAMSAMRDIQQSSSQIGQILGLIDDIAFQTNLLSLNAGVEAARAGDAGRGFAVVASEVRALAQRSAEAAKEIKSLILSSTQQVGKGTALVQETGSAMEMIVTNVSEISVLIGEIATAAQSQANNLSEISISIGQMDQNTQQNAAMVEEATAASHNLSGEAKELVRLLKHFRVGAYYEFEGEPSPLRVVNSENNSNAFVREDSHPVIDDGWEEFRE